MGNLTTYSGPAASIPNISVLHEVPGRCRLRVARLRFDGSMRQGLAQRLTASPLVASFRFNLACESITVVHVGLMSPLFVLLSQPIDRLDALLPQTPVALKAPSIALAQPYKSLAWAGVALVLGPIAGPMVSILLIVLTGWPIWRRALGALVHERRLNVDFLDGLALAIALVRQQSRTAALMAFMVHLGDVVRELTAGQSRGQIRELLDFQAVQARRIESDGSITLVPAKSILADQMTLLLAGDLVPADGRVSSGEAALDQRHITGESAPAIRRVGDMVFAGSSVVEGSLTVRITEAGADTAIAKIVALVEAAPVGETRIQNYAEQFADRLVAPLLGVNLGLLALTGNMDRFMSMAIVDYGTGIRVAAPTSVLASMTRAARQGILIKSGRHVEQLATLRGIAFDKTGTLTSGHLVVLDVRRFTNRLSADRILQLAAAAETQLRHPVARALVSHARDVRGLDLPPCENLQFVIGFGVSADIEGYRIHVGSERYLRSLNISTKKAKDYLGDAERSGYIVLLVALDEVLIGVIACSDEPRPEAAAVIAGLRQRGVRDIVMLSGDRDGVARRIARSVGIEQVYSEVLPHEKADLVRTLRAAAKGPFAMVGDGVNDSPALAQADVVLMEEGLHLLLPAIDISRDALSLVRQNYTLIAGANTLALALAIPSGLMSPMACTLLSNGSALLATMNAMRPLLASRKVNPLPLKI